MLPTGWGLGMGYGTMGGMHMGPMMMGQMRASGMMSGVSEMAAAAAARSSALGMSFTQEDQEEKEKAVIVRALREIAEKKAMEQALEGAKNPRREPAAKPKKADEEDVDKKPRCHLHKKPNAKCKKCQQALADQSQTADADRERDDVDTERGVREATETAKKLVREEREKDRQHFNCSPMLKDQILKSSYFRSMQEIGSLVGLAHEIAQYADTIDVYNHASRTDPSCFICQVLRLSTLAHRDEDLHVIIDNRDSAKVRCVGFVYLRFMTAPSDLFEVFEEYLLDDMELRYTHEGCEIITTIGEYVEGLLVNEKYFESPLPRIPVTNRRQLEEKIGPMMQHRKRMAANRLAIRPDNVDGMSVEVHMDGNWVRGSASELTGRSAGRAHVRIWLDSGAQVVVPMGRLVRRERSRSRSRKSRSRSRGRKSRSRSRSRGRGNSPDWSYRKGKSDADMVDELRTRLRENAVCGHGKNYAKRPIGFDASMLSVSTMSAYSADPLQEASGSRRSARREAREEPEESDSLKRMRREDEQKRQLQLQSVYQKYCASSASSVVSSGRGSSKDIDRPDVLRLG